MPNWRRLLRQDICLAFSLARASVGSSIAARMAIMAMTTSSSIKVNAHRSLWFICINFIQLVGSIFNLNAIYLPAKALHIAQNIRAIITPPDLFLEQFCGTRPFGVAIPLNGNVGKLIYRRFGAMAGFRHLITRVDALRPCAGREAGTAPTNKAK